MEENRFLNDVNYVPAGGRSSRYVKSPPPSTPSSKGPSASGPNWPKIQAVATVIMAVMMLLAFWQPISAAVVSMLDKASKLVWADNQDPKRGQAREAGKTKNEHALPPAAPAEQREKSEEPVTPLRSQAYSQPDAIGQTTVASRTNSPKTHPAGAGPQPRFEIRERLPMEAIEFAAIAGEGNAEQLLVQHPEARGLYRNLQRNHWVLGISHGEQPIYVPLPQKSMEPEFQVLAKRGLKALHLIEIHVPAEWTQEQLDSHLDRWASNSAAVTRQNIEAWSTVRAAPSEIKQNGCVLGGICLIVTSSWTPHAFSDFHVWEPLGSETK